MKNIIEFQEITITDTLDTAKISTHFKALHNDKFVFVNNQLYYYNSYYWVKDSKKYSFLNTFISSVYYSYLQDVLNKLTTENSKVTDVVIKQNNDQKLLNMRQRVSGLLNHRKRKDYIEDIICAITNDDIQFDNNPFLFAFKNKVYDLQKNKFVKPKAEQYISYTTGYEYKLPSEELEQELDTFIDTIFPQPEIKHLYLTILSTGLLGVNLEKFIVANGGGGNGKGVINEFVQTVLGEYCYVMPSSVLLSPLKTGSNPEIANMNNKRLIICREPDSTQKINSSTMKELTGSDEVNARLNHSNVTKTLIKSTLIMECNNKPKLDEITDAVARRIIDIPFKSTFVDQSVYDILKDDQKENTFVINPYYKSKEFKEKYKLAMFHILIKKYGEYVRNGSKLPMCKEVMERNKEYLKSSDDIGEYIGDVCEKDEELNAKGTLKHRIKLKSIFEEFKKTEIYQNYDRKEKQLLTYKNFQVKLKANIFLRYSIKKDKDDTYQLMGYKWRKAAEEDDDDDKNLDL